MSDVIEDRLAELNAAYRNEGFFARLGKIFRGIGKPRSSREYKEARLEVQRLAAPFIAIVAPVVFILVLCVVTEVTGHSKTRIDVEIARAQEDEATLEEEQNEQDLEQPPDTEVDFSVDADVPVEVEVNTPALQTPDQSLRQPDPTSVAAIKSPVTMNSVYGETRSAASRLAAMQKYGGDPRTEISVMNALRWLKTQQQPDGSWSGVAGDPRDNMGVTGLVILTFLAHGEKSGGGTEFGDCVARGLEWLMANADNLDPMGVHALAEAYGFLKNPNLKLGATRAVKQLSDKLAGTTWGITWGSEENVRKNTRPVLLRMVYETMALRSAKLSGIQPKNLDAALAKLRAGFLFQANLERGGFTSDSIGPELVGKRLTGSWHSIVGIVGLQYLGDGDHPVVEKTMRILDDDWEPPTLGCIDTSCCPVRGNYWATMVFFNGGGKRWQQWNRKMIDVYFNGQTVQRGAYTDMKGIERDMGYWTCEDMHIGTQPITTTCWVAQQLMVYYRYLPTSSKSAWTKLEPETEEVKEESADVDVEVDI